MIASGKRRFLVDAKEPSLVPDLLDSLRQEFPGCRLSIHEDPLSFSSASMAGDMFLGDGMKITVLWDLSEESMKSLESILDFTSDDVLMVVQRKSIPKGRLYTRMKAEWEVITLEPLDDRACEAYAAAALKKIGCKFSPEVPSVITDRRGRDLPAIRNEVKKFSLLGKPIDKDTAAKLVCGKESVKVFDLADAVLRRRWSQSCALAATLPENDLIGFLHAVQTQCTKLYKAASLKEQGMAPDDIASMLEVPAYIAKTKIVPLALQMGRNRILKMIDAVHAADVTARTSRIPKRLLMESVVIKLLKS
jgi:DNA polymerase III delta subunit